MSTRRFEAATTPAALDAVRAAFGEDAFILSNRRMGDRVEIIASRSGVDEAVESAPELADAAGEAAPRTTRISIESLSGALGAPTVPPADELPQDGGGSEERMPDPATAPATVDMAAIDAAVRAAVNASLSALLPAMAVQAAATADAAQRMSGTRAEAVDESAAVTMAEDAPDEPDLEPVPPEPVDVAAEAMRVAVATAASLSDTAEARLCRIEVALWGKEDTPRSHLLDRLLQLGLGAATAVRLSEQARGEDTDMLMRDALIRLRNSLPILRDAGTGAQGVLGVKLLSGPDSDARLAALLQFARAAIALEGPRSVALVSADTGRTGAFSLLEECARELGCVAVRVRHANDLEATLTSLSDRACVLVDAGNAWPASASVHQRLLVLPATLQRTACAASIDAARYGQADGCVLCALHAAGRPGESLEALVDRWLPIAFWSDSDAPDVVPRRAEAALIVAAAIGAARRLGSSEHDRLLGALMHPGRGSLAAGFVTAVQIPGEAVKNAGLSSVSPSGPTPGSAPGGSPEKASVLDGSAPATTLAGEITS